MDYSGEHRDVGRGREDQVRGAGKHDARKSNSIIGLRLSLCHSHGGPTHEDLGRQHPTFGTDREVNPDSQSMATRDVLKISSGVWSWMTADERCRLGMIPEAMPVIFIASTPDDPIYLSSHPRTRKIDRSWPHSRGHVARSDLVGGVDQGRPKGSAHGAVSRGGSTPLYVLRGMTAGDTLEFARCHPPGLHACSKHRFQIGVWPVRGVPSSYRGAGPISSVRVPPE